MRAAEVPQVFHLALLPEEPADGVHLCGHALDRSDDLAASVNGNDFSTLLHLRPQARHLHADDGADGVILRRRVAEGASLESADDLSPLVDAPGDPCPDVERVGAAFAPGGLPDDRVLDVISSHVESCDLPVVIDSPGFTVRLAQLGQRSVTVQEGDARPTPHIGDADHLALGVDGARLGPTATGERPEIDNQIARLVAPTSRGKAGRREGENQKEGGAKSWQKVHGKSRLWMCYQSAQS